MTKSRDFAAPRPPPPRTHAQTQNLILQCHKINTCMQSLTWLPVHTLQALFISNTDIIYAYNYSVTMIIMQTKTHMTVASYSINRVHMWGH